MNLAPLEQINNLQSAPPNQQSPDALRKAATQFEAVLLMQLTSALNDKNEGDEDQLFGSDGGTDMAKKMFSEQLATTMSQSGGIGLSDLIMQKFGGTETKSETGKIKNLSGAIAAIKDIKQNGSIPANFSAALTSKVSPNSSAAFSNTGEAEIVSTFDDLYVKTGDIDESLKSLVLDGKILNSTRPRIVPNSPVTQVNTISANTAFSDSSQKTTFQMPVNGRISSDFGSRFHPIDKKIKFHGGIDIAVPLYTPVGAAADGVVKFAGKSEGYGNLVVIEHADGRETRYGHLSEIQVSEGDAVAIGQQIALSGSTGKSTGPHVHFEIRENEQVVNPLKILSNVLPKAAER